MDHIKTLTILIKQHLLSFRRKQLTKPIPRLKTFYLKPVLLFSVFILYYLITLESSYCMEQVNTLTVAIENSNETLAREILESLESRNQHDLQQILEEIRRIQVMNPQSDLALINGQIQHTGNPGKQYDTTSYIPYVIVGLTLISFGVILYYHRDILWDFFQNAFSHSTVVLRRIVHSEITLLTPEGIITLHHFMSNQNMFNTLPDFGGTGRS